METALFAQAAAGIPQLIIWAMVIGGAIGIGLIVLRQAGIDVPPFVLQILWIVLVVVLGVVAIHLLTRFL